MFSRRKQGKPEPPTTTEKTEVVTESLAQLEIDTKKENSQVTRSRGGFKDLSQDELQDVVQVLSKNSPMEKFFGKPEAY